MVVSSKAGGWSWGKLNCQRRFAVLFIHSCDKILYNMPNRIRERCFGSLKSELIYVPRNRILLTPITHKHTFNYFIFNVIKLSLSYVFFWTKGKFLFKINKMFSLICLHSSKEPTSQIQIRLAIAVAQLIIFIRRVVWEFKVSVRRSSVIILVGCDYSSTCLLKVVQERPNW